MDPTGGRLFAAVLQRPRHGRQRVVVVATRTAAGRRLVTGGADCRMFANVGLAAGRESGPGVFSQDISVSLARLPLDLLSM